METLLIILATIASGLVTSAVASIFAYYFGERKKKHIPTYHEKMMQLTESLNKASADVDSILQEMSQIAEERQKALSALEQKQTELQAYVDSLEKGPAETLKIYQQIVTQLSEKQDKDSRRLALKYFILGSFVTLIVTIISIVITLHPF